MGGEAAQQQAQRPLVGAFDNRIEWIDGLRGLTMIFVVVGHIMPADDGFRAWIYSFQVPLFFFLSGVTFKPRASFGALVKTQARKLLVPYYCFGLLSLIIYALIGSVAVGVIGRAGMDTSFTRGLAMLLYGNGKAEALAFNTPLWFLTALFVIDLIAGLALGGASARATRGRWVGNAVIASVVCALFGFCYQELGPAWPLPYGIETAASLAPFFFAGAIAQRLSPRGLAGLRFDRAKGWAILLIIVSGALGGVCAGFNLTIEITNYVNDFFGNWLLFYGGAFGQTIAWVVAFILLRRLRPLSFVGRHTMAILVMHKFPIVAAQLALARIAATVPWMNTANLFIVAVIAAIAIAFSLGVEVLIDRICPWLLGKSPTLKGSR